MMTKLSDICMFQSGGTPSRKNSEYFNGNIPWVTTTALNGGTISLENANEWITLKAIEESAAKLVPAHSILVGTRVGVGKVAINLVPMSTSQDIISLTGIDQNQWNLEFLCKFISSKSAYLNSQARGATIKGIKIETLAELELPSYSIPEQHLISSAFNSLEKSISLRKQQLAKLDELVKSRFIELFGEPETNPYGWKQTTVGEVCSSIVRGPFGSALKKEFFVEPNETTYKVYEQKHAIQKSATIGTYYITAEKFDELRRFECVAGDILMSCSGTMGELYQLPEGCEKGLINQALCKFTLNKKILPIVFLTYMKQTIGKLETKGSGIQNIAAVSYVKAMPINLAPMEVQEQFAAFVEQVDKSKFEIQKSLEKLETLKKALMQKYFG
jgi:type I restriction enzyme S subunit